MPVTDLCSIVAQVMSKTMHGLSKGENGIEYDQSWICAL